MTPAVQGTPVFLLARAHQSRAYQCRDLAPMWGAFGVPHSPTPQTPPTPTSPPSSRLAANPPNPRFCGPKPSFQSPKPGLESLKPSFQSRKPVRTIFEASQSDPLGDLAWGTRVLLGSAEKLLGFELRKLGFEALAGWAARGSTGKGVRGIG